MTPSPYGRQTPRRQETSSGSSSTTDDSSSDEPRLADARRADERDELGVTLAAGAGERVAEQLDLVGCRPTSGARPRSREVGADRERAPTACQASTGSVLPFARTGSNASVLDRARGREVGRLADEDAVRPARPPARRAATLTKSGDDPLALGPGGTSGLTSASPVLTPMRTASSLEPSALAELGMASRIASAARTARSGSSSCATGSAEDRHDARRR